MCSLQGNHMYYILIKDDFYEIEVWIYASTQCGLMSPESRVRKDV
jgi:hypothetical protein